MRTMNEWCVRTHQQRGFTVSTVIAKLAHTRKRDHALKRAHGFKLRKPQPQCRSKNCNNTNNRHVHVKIYLSSSSPLCFAAALSTLFYCQFVNVSSTTWIKATGEWWRSSFVDIIFYLLLLVTQHKIPLVIISQSSCHHWYTDLDFIVEQTSAAL